MVNINTQYDDETRDSTKVMFESLGARIKSLPKDLQQDVGLDIRLGDVYGPNRESMAIQINLPTAFILVECNSGTWRIGFFKLNDLEASDGIYFTTSTKASTLGNTQFEDWLFEFILEVV
jgi:hypothetical protein